MYILCMYHKYNQAGSWSSTSHSDADITETSHTYTVFHSSNENLTEVLDYIKITTFSQF